MFNSQRIIVDSRQQILYFYAGQAQSFAYSISTGLNGMGEKEGSGATPRGLHRVHQILGLENHANDVFVGRVFTGEVYTSALAQAFPARDWILTRIIQLEGQEEGINLGAGVDTLARYIYIHGTPDTTPLGQPGSHGCIRMKNQDIIALTARLKLGTEVLIL
jgi:hypothetical protein